MTEDMPRITRNLLRRLDRASLASGLPGQDGTAWPYASLVHAPPMPVPKRLTMREIHLPVTCP